VSGPFYFGGHCRSGSPGVGARPAGMVVGLLPMQDAGRGSPVAVWRLGCCRCRAPGVGARPAGL